MTPENHCPGCISCPCCRHYYIYPVDRSQEGATTYMPVFDPPGLDEGPSDRDYTWTDIMTLAIEDQHGASQVKEYDRTIGPFTVHVKRTENRSGKALELYRDTGASQHRYAALGIRKETVLDSQRSRFPFLGSERRKLY